MIGALLGAGASIYGAKLGADASNNAAAYNHQIDMLNYIQRERERFDSINQARKADTENKLGTTDAQGNRSYFKPGVGWVTELADDQQALQELYEREETEQLNNDLQKQRGVFNDNIERQGDENVLADALLREFTGHVRDDPRNIEGMMNNASVKGITEGFDSALEDAMRAAIRTGASNSGYVAADVGRERAAALEQAFMQNKINSRQMVQDEHASARSNSANLYNMMATRASALPGVGYNPRNIEGQTAGAQAQAAQRALATGGNLMNAFAKQGGVMPRIDPNYGAANAWASSGNVLAGLGERMQAANQRKQGFSALDNFVRTGKMVDQSSGQF